MLKCRQTPLFSDEFQPSGDAGDVMLIFQGVPLQIRQNGIARIECGQLQFSELSCKHFSQPRLAVDFRMQRDLRVSLPLELDARSAGPTSIRPPLPRSLFQVVVVTPSGLAKCSAGLLLVIG